jgi:hypothetical protein
MIQQGRLTDAGLAPHDDHLAVTGSHAPQQPIQDVALVATTAQRWARRHRFGRYIDRSITSIKSSSIDVPGSTDGADWRVGRFERQAYGAILGL